MRAWVAFPLIACAGAVSPGPPARRGTPIAAPEATHGIPGEAMTYVVRLRGVLVGRVAVAVGQPGWVEGRHAIIVRSRGQTEGVLSIVGDLSWELTTTLDLDRGLPIRAHEEANVVVPGKREHEEHDDTWSDDDLHHNVHSVVGVVRSWQARRSRTPLEVDIARARLDVEMWEGAHEYLTSARMPAVRYDGMVEERIPFQTWVSDDADRVPLLLRARSRWGEIEVELVEYRAPRG